MTLSREEVLGRLAEAAYVNNDVTAMVRELQFTYQGTQSRMGNKSCVTYVDHLLYLLDEK